MCVNEKGRECEGGSQEVVVMSFNHSGWLLVFHEGNGGENRMEKTDREQRRKNFLIRNIEQLLIN